MRILQVIETGGTGGAETVFVQLATGLKNRGHYVASLTGRGNWLSAELGRRDVFCALRDDAGAFDVRLLWQIRTLIHDHGIDLVHAHLFDSSVYATVASKLKGVPTVATFHGQSDIKRMGLTTRVKAAILRHGTSAVVAVSGALRDDIQRTLRIDHRRMHVILNGLECVSRQEQTHRESVDSANAERVFRLIALGNIRPTKDYPTMLRAVASLVTRGVNVRLEILGEPELPWLYQELIDLRRDLGLAERVAFRGFVSDPFPLLAKADCFVLSSSSEGFSLAIVEAMLAGLPIVATSCGGPQDIVSNEHTGLIVPLEDPEALADAIERISTDRHLGLRLGEAARIEAAKYGIEKMVNAYETLYAGLLTKGVRSIPRGQGATP